MFKRKKRERTVAEAILHKDREMLQARLLPYIAHALPAGLSSPSLVVEDMWLRILSCLLDNRHLFAGFTDAEMLQLVDLQIALILDGLLERQRRVSDPPGMSDAFLEGAGHGPARQTRRRRALQDFARLSHQQRQVIRMAIVMSLPVSKIARELCLSRRTAKAMLQEAVGQLRKSFVAGASGTDEPSQRALAESSMLDGEEHFGGGLFGGDELHGPETTAGEDRDAQRIQALLKHLPPASKYHLLVSFLRSGPSKDDLGGNRPPSDAETRRLEVILKRLKSRLAGYYEDSPGIAGSGA